MRDLILHLPATVRSHFTDIHRGIKACVHEHDQWRIHRNLSYRFSQSEQSLAVLKKVLIEEAYDGVLGYAHKPEDIEAYEQLEVPCVIITPDLEDLRFITLNEDLEYSVQLILEYLDACGYHALAILDQSYTESPRRERMFKVVSRCWTDMGHQLTALEMVNFNHQFPEWLVSTSGPKVFFDVSRGRLEYAHQCGREMNLRMPRDLGLFSYHPLEKLHEELPDFSTLDHKGYGIGYQACKLLMNWVETGVKPEQPKLWREQSILVNETTYQIHSNDEDVNLVMQFIDQHFKENIQVEDMMAVVNISRRTLEKKFVHHHQMTPNEYLTHKRLVTLQKLLTQSSLPLSTLAAHAGFNDPRYMSRVFKKHLGMSPREFRTQHRASS